MATSPSFDEYGLTDTREVERLTGAAIAKRSVVAIGGGWTFWRVEGSDRWWPSEIPVTMLADEQERSQAEEPQRPASA